MALLGFTIGIVVSIWASQTRADPVIGCGIQPIAPIGCWNRGAKCLCDKDGNCYWVFKCDDYE